MAVSSQAMGSASPNPSTTGSFSVVRSGATAAKLLRNLSGAFDGQSEVGLGSTGPVREPCEDQLFIAEPTRGNELREVDQIVL